MRAAMVFARYFLPPSQGASGAAGGAGVSAPGSAGMSSGMDKGAASHDHDPAAAAVAGRPGLAGSGRGREHSRFGVLLHPGPRPGHHMAWQRSGRGITCRTGLWEADHGPPVWRSDRQEPLDLADTFDGGLALVETRRKPFRGRAGQRTLLRARPVTAPDARTSDTPPRSRHRRWRSRAGSARCRIASGLAGWSPRRDTMRAQSRHPAPSYLRSRSGSARPRATSSSISSACS